MVKSKANQKYYEKNSQFKDTCYLWGKNSKNLQLLDIPACNSANNPSFWKRLYVRFWKDGLLAKLLARMSRSRYFGLKGSKYP